MGVINKPHTFSPNTTISSSEVNANFDTLYNDYNGSISAANLASNAVVTAKIADSAVTTAKINDAAVTAPKINFGGSGAGVWWEEVGRTTLASAGDTITVSSIPARKYLLIRYLLLATGGTNNSGFTFNSDTGSNYAQTVPDLSGGGAALSSTSQTSLPLENGSPSSASVMYGFIDTVNIAAQPKVMIYQNGWNVASAGTAPIVTLAYGKWSNTSAQISAVTFTNGGTGDYAIGSEVTVLGHD